MARKDQGNQSSLNVKRTLQWLRKNKFKPVPLHHQSKSVAIRDYASPDYEPPGDEFWSKNNYGVGCITGPPGPIDVDLDCKEAIFFAPYFLPKTKAVFGRKSKPSSHYLYRVNTTQFDPAAVKDKKTDRMVIEARGGVGAHQTVMPGSLHEDTGELIEWTYGPDPEVQEEDADKLLLAMRKIALAVQLVRYVWGAGNHNAPTLYLTGTFFYLQWPLEETEHFIQTLMDFDNDKDRSRMMTVRNTYKRAENGGKIQGSGAMRKAVKDDALVDQILELAGSPTVNLLNEYNEHYAVVTIGNKFRIASFEVPPTDPPIFMAKDDFLNWTATDYTTIDNKPVQKSKLWLANPRRRTYHGADFLPGEETNGVLNLWTGWAVEPSREGSCEAWLKLLRDVICGGDEVLNTWCLNWFANIVREPQRKPLTALAIIGKQGVGKSLLFLYFGRILGKCYLPVTDERHLHGNFNAHMSNTLLLHGDEALWGGDIRHRGKLKATITDDYRIVERKGIDAFRVRNFLRLALTSNEQRAAPAEASDRRHTVINMGERDPDNALCQAVLYEIDHGGPARLFQFFMDFSYDPTIPRINIKNEALSELQDVNESPLESWWHEKLKEGVLLPDCLAWASIGSDPLVKEDWPAVISGQALYSAMILDLRDRGARIPTQVQFGIELKKLVGRKLDHSQRTFNNVMVGDMSVPAIVRKMSSGKQNSITDMPTLEECRKAYVRHRGGKVNWPKEDDTPPQPAQKAKF